MREPFTKNRMDRFEIKLAIILNEKGITINGKIHKITLFIPFVYAKISL